jgi:hypothetical protein
MIIIYVMLGLNCAFIMCLFSFWLGRCARRLPVIDDNLPWTISRDKARRCPACPAACGRPLDPPR